MQPSTIQSLAQPPMQIASILKHNIFKSPHQPRSFCGGFDTKQDWSHNPQTSFNAFPPAKSYVSPSIVFPPTPAVPSGVFTQIPKKSTGPIIVAGFKTMFYRHNN